MALVRCWVFISLMPEIYLRRLVCRGVLRGSPNVCSRGAIAPRQTFSVDETPSNGVKSFVNNLNYRLEF